jgi:AcrR family transcriptional regulator
MGQPRSAFDEKLESILRRAAVIFAEKGYHQASIRDIARATGVSLSGLYYYFQSKEELLFLIQDHSLETLLSDLDTRLSGVTEPERKLRLLVENQLRFFLEHMPEMKLLSRESDSLTGELRERVRARRRRLVEIAEGILAELRPESDLHPRVSVFSLFGMMNWVYTWYRADRDPPAERLAAEMSGIFLHGYLHGPVGASGAAWDSRPAEAWHAPEGH